MDKNYDEIWLYPLWDERGQLSIGEWTCEPPELSGGWELETPGYPIRHHMAQR